MIDESAILRGSEMMPFAESFTDAEAAERLLNRACREWAEMAYNGGLNDGFCPIYGWLKTVAMEAGDQKGTQARDPITGQNLGPSD